MLAYQTQAEAIRDARVQLTQALFQHPPNPYECYLLSPPEQDILRHLYKGLGVIDKGQEPSLLPQAWQHFWQQQKDDQLLWANINRRNGSFSLHCAPVEVASALSPIWARQPVVLIGSALDQDTEAPIYRQSVGLSDLTCLKFSANRHSELIQLYLPDKLPLPNTPQFQAALIEKSTPCSA